MMSDEVRLSTEELRTLGATFEIRAEELSRQLAAFRRRADAEALRDGFGGDEAARPYRELYEQAEHALVQLQQRLAEVGGGLKETVANTQATEDELVEMMRSVK
ncbi:WXG100 family type VII secretion target [Streptomyces sirii]